MSEQPAVPAAPSDTDLSDPSLPAGPADFVLPARQPKAFTKADLLPAVSIASLVALVGLPVAWIWSRLAPPEQVGVSTNGQVLPLTDESYHRFDDLAIFLLLGLAAGLLTGAATWLLRERRGPTILIAAVLGSLIAAYLAMQTGLSFAAGRYVLSGAPKIGSVFEMAPRLESGWVLIAEPLGAALAYGVLAAWHGSKDLGRRLG
ncbi:MAG TPA: DUF2567 domain-containing protein [Pseudonocardiaceae bacterium]|nr:DUF2567 domain-containing protein [Pseudonocardiaceae bacterium]